MSEREPSAETHEQPFDAALISPRRASMVLSLGVSGAARPIDRVIEMLSAADAVAALEATAAQTLDVSMHEIFDPETSLERLRAIKERAKCHFSESADDDATAIAVYFFAIAAAALHHNVNISTRTGPDLFEPLIDLGEACPPQWRDFVRGAVLKISDPAPEDW